MKKRILTVLLTLMMAVSFVPMLGNEACGNFGVVEVYAGTNHSQSEAVSWISARKAERWARDYDGVNGAQCVDLIEYYFDYLVGYHLTGNGYDYVGRGDLPSGWCYTSSPSPGDIAVWAKNKGIAREWGHVALVESVSGGSFNYVDVNGANHTGGSGTLANSNPSSFIHPDFGPSNHAPCGSLDVCQGGVGTVRVAGWAKDDDAPSAQIEVHVYIGGGPGTSGVEGHPIRANGSRPDVGNHAYDTVINTRKTGSQEIYVYAIDSAGGTNQIIGHTTVNIENPNPVGVIDSVTDNKGSVKVSGWAFDPSDTSKQITLHVYVGGPAGSGARCYPITADKERVDVDNAYHCGKYHGFGAVIPTDLRGSQAVYIYGINIGSGWENTCFGNRTVTITEHIHSLVKTPAKAATTSTEGNIEYWTCSSCGKYFKDSAGKTEITKAQTVIPKLNPSNPSNQSGGNDNTGGNSNAGGNTNNNSSVSGSDTVKVTLPAVKIAKPKAAKKSVTVKWKKVSKKNQKKIKKIQIQISTDASFSNVVKVSTASSKKTSKKVKGLRKGTRYYVRVRGINGGQISAWSGVKSFKAK